MGEILGVVYETKGNTWITITINNKNEIDLTEWFSEAVAEAYIKGFNQAIQKQKEEEEEDENENYNLRLGFLDDKIDEARDSGSRLFMMWKESTKAITNRLDHLENVVNNLCEVNETLTNLNKGNI